MSTLRPYSTYKPSGLPWLGDVPGHWEVQRGKALLAPVDIRSTSGDEELLTVSAQRGVVPRETANVTMFKAASYVGYKLCWPRDLVVNSLWAWAHGLGVSQHHGIVSSAYGVYRPLPKANARFIHLLARSIPFQWELQVRSKGIWVSRLQLTDEAFLGTPFPVPPLPEQAAIVRYLDHVDRRIRRFISAKQNLIALLKEERQVVINHAVTRGLDPNVRLKPSGVEWLGDVPEHWEVKKITHMFSIGSGTTPPTDHPEFYGGDVSWITTSELRESIVTSTQKTVTKEALRLFPALRIYPTDSVAVAMYGATIGRVGILGTPAAVNQACCVFSGSKGIEPWFWCYWLQSRRHVLVSMGYGGGQPNLSLELLRSIRVATPSLVEQAAIVDYLEKATTDIDAALALARRQIELVQEYRTRLISDVVTGKLDVREAAARLPDETAEEEPFNESDLTENADDSLYDAKTAEAVS